MESTDSGRRGRFGRLARILLFAALGCGDGGGPAPDEAVAGAGGLDRAEVLGPFLASYWSLPVPAQGPAPEGWSPLESSLAPRDCGACHPSQYAQWRGTLHAAAYSPGFGGQLIEGALAAPADVRRCQTCHAPLAEQQPYDASGAENPGYDAALRDQGIVCASCHVRAHRRRGPPRRAEVAVPTGETPHGGFEPRVEFTESRFCAECHQFFDDPGVNGKPLENTYAEWLASPAAAQGRTCQSCHMPDRAHEWRGIHDPEMVRSGVAVELELEAAGDRLRAGLWVHSREIGHHFPSYLTARVFLDLWQEDGDGREIPETRVLGVVGRRVDFSTGREVFDTRIPAGGSQRLPYDEARRPEAHALAGRVRVAPDHHYQSVFASLLEAYEAPEARERIRRAHQTTLESEYVLWEIRRPLGPPEAR